MKRISVMLFLLFIAAPVNAGSNSLVVVAFNDNQHVSTVLRQQADYVSMSVTITSEQRDPLQRMAEIRDAKQHIQKKAEDNKDIIVRTGPVTLSAEPVSKLASFSSYSSRSSESDLYILVPFKDRNRDIFACASLIRTFLNTFSLNGKVSLQTGQIQLAADNPEQYRSTLLQMITEDVSKTRQSLKTDGVVRLSGLESPVLVREADDQNIELFINYQLSMEIK